MMRTFEHRQSQSISPHHEHLPGVDAIEFLLNRKPQRDWSVESRDSTPNLNDQQQKPSSGLQYWKDLASHNASLIRAFSPSTDHRKSIASVEYWETEARHLDQKYWSILQKAQEQSSTKRRKHTKRKTSRVTKPGHSFSGHISSRLRSSDCQSDTAKHSTTKITPRKTRGRPCSRKQR